MKIIKNSIAIVAISMCGLSAGETLAVVNGHDITTEDANTYLQATGAPQTFEQATDANKENIINRLVERELFVEAAQKSGVEKDPKFVKMLETAKEDLLVSEWMKKKFDAVAVSDSDAKAFYEKNKDKYKKPEQVKARHILVKSEDDAKAIIKELKPLKADELKNKFIELAKSKSTGPSGKSGGDLGYFGPKAMVKPFDDAVFSMKIGEITPIPVKTQFGYHIIYLEDKKPAAATPYETMKAQIMQTLKQKQFRENIDKNLKELKSKAKVVIEKKK